MTPVGRRTRTALDWPRGSPPLPGQVYYMPPGPSRTDSLVWLRPHLIVDKDNVWLIPSLTNPDQTIKHFPRRGAGVCDPLAILN